MGNNGSRAGVLVGLGAAAGVFGVAAMMSAATAPTARADDFGDVISEVNTSFAGGQFDFTNAFSDFDSGDVNDGVGYFISGVDEDFVAAPDSLYVGSVDLLTNESVLGFSFGVPPESDFTSASSDAEAYFAASQTYLTIAETALFQGDYSGAAQYDALGSFDDIAALQVLFEGVVASF